jgi:hypothetical protein
MLGSVTGQPAHPSSAPVVDVVDDTFLACGPAQVADVVADPQRWDQWWPDLRLRTTRDRGVKGRQWTVTGALVGTAEIWLEPWWDGVVLHYYLRADPVGRAGGAGQDTQRWAARERQRRVQRWKGHVHRLKDDLEAGRRPGEASSGTRPDQEGVRRGR